MKKLRIGFFMFVALIFFFVCSCAENVAADDNPYNIKKYIGYVSEGEYKKNVYVYWDNNRNAMVIKGSGEMASPGFPIQRLIDEITRKIYAQYGDGDIDYDSPRYHKLEEEANAFLNKVKAPGGLKLIIEDGVEFPEDSTMLFSGDSGTLYSEIIFPKDLSTSHVKFMVQMFFLQPYVNPDVSKWDVSNVEDFEQMFAYTGSANPDVSNWNTSKAKSMNGMFIMAKAANPDVSKWNTSSLTLPQYMFYGADSANPDLSHWDLRKSESIAYMLSMSSVRELDCRTWPLNLDRGNISNLFSYTPKLQYVYLPANHNFGPDEFLSADPIENAMSEDFKMQRDGEPSSSVIEGSHNSFLFKPTGLPTVYFVPQNIVTKSTWKDSNDKNGVRPKELKLTLLANKAKISGNIEKPKENPVKVNPKNNWTANYTGLDIFSNGSKIDYSILLDPIDDYVTEFKDYIPDLPEKERLKTRGIEIINTYMEIAEEKPFGTKPKCPENFVRVVVDTTDKASSATYFKRAFWVTPNKEVKIPISNPTGKMGWVFTSWKSENDGTVWKPDQAIKKQFKDKETLILAQYDKVWLGIKKVDVNIHKAYIFGYPDKTLRPNNYLTRAEAAALAVRLAEFKADNTDKLFDDALANAWYNPYINLAYEKDMLQADNNLIRPNDFITRAEFAKLISPLDKENSSKSDFTDIKGHRYEKEINQAFANKRICGYPDKTFRPDKFISRAEASKILNSLFKRSADRNFIDANPDKLKSYKDLDKNSWAYYDLQDAANSRKYKRSSDSSLDEIWLEILP